jgi:hypothetical protein
MGVCSAKMCCFFSSRTFVPASQHYWTGLAGMPLPDFEKEYKQNQLLLIQNLPELSAVAI